VRRHEHAHGASVYAFTHELEAWWRNERRSSRKPSSKEISRAASENKTTKSSAGNGRGRTQGPGTPAGSGSNEIQTGFDPAGREIAIVLFLLSLLKGVRLAKISEQQLQVIGGRFELDRAARE
jgi:hypothetical protein